MIEIRGNKGTVREEAVRSRYEAITKQLIKTGRTVTTMESCTAGQVISLLTDTEGSSAAVKGAFVTYSNEAKRLAGVAEEILQTYGVYSAQTAEAMAKACRSRFQADFGIGVTGSFGNADPNNRDSVPGEVFFALSSEQGVESFHSILPPLPSRLMYKLYMADLIADVMEEALGLKPEKGFAP